MTKHEGMSNDEMAKFGLRASFVIRHSDFAINVTSFSIEFVALDAPMPQPTRLPLQYAPGPVQ